MLVYQREKDKVLIDPSPSDPSPPSGCILIPPASVQLLSDHSVSVTGSNLRCLAEALQLDIHLGHLRALQIQALNMMNIDE
jgi:hypothetical protein